MPFDTAASRFARWAHRATQVILFILVWLVAQALWPDWIRSLETVAWLFVFYMLARVLLVMLQIPKVFIYEIPLLVIPEQIHQGSLPMRGRGAVWTSRTDATWELVKTLQEKVINAAEEGSIYTLLHERLATMRKRAHERFSEVAREVDTLAFEGIIGTLLGMMVFMAQASKLFVLPELGQDLDRFADVLLSNLRSLNFLAVLTAFVTSVIGWGTKAWVGRIIGRRRDVELQSITRVEEYLQTHILARLSLPSRSVVEHTLSLEHWLQLLRGGLRLRVHHVEGGLLLTPWVDESVAVVRLEEETHE